MKKIYFKDWLDPIDKKAKSRDVKISSKNKKRMHGIYSNDIGAKSIAELLWVHYYGIPGPELLQNLVYNDNPFLKLVKKETQGSSSISISIPLTFGKKR